MTRRYWDSCCFLNWLMEEGALSGSEMVIDEAERGKLEIVTSSLTLAEVLWLRGKSRVPEDRAERVQSFFQNSYILVRELDRKIAEDARALVWTHNVPPKDAIHLATALSVHQDTPLDQLDTFDNDDLIPHSEKLGAPPLKIGLPGIPGRLL